MLHTKWQPLVRKYYETLQKCVPHIPQFIETIESSINDIEKDYLKENLYTVDTWLFQEVLHHLDTNTLTRHMKYSDYSILGILASLKDTLLGFILYYVYVLEQAQKNWSIYIAEDLLLKIYIIDVLNITEEYHPFFAGMINYLVDLWRPLWSLRIWLDDNKDYFQIWYENRKYFILNKTSEDIITGVVGEDIIRLRGFLKNIRYYNNRFVMPGK